MKDIYHFYEVLGLDPNVSLNEVKQAYKDLVKVWHPDRFSHDPRLQKKAQEKLKEVNDAFEHIILFFKESQDQNISQRYQTEQYQQAEKTQFQEFQEPPEPPPITKTPRKSSKVSPFWIFILVIIGIRALSNLSGMFGGISRELTPQIKGEATKKEAALLKPKIIEAGYLELKVSPWADVYADGHKIATTPIAKPLKIAPGTHTILLSNPSCEEWLESIYFKPGQIVKKNVLLKPKVIEVGYLKLKVSPWADVYVDGHKIATTPITKPLKIAPGTHTILLSNPSCKEWFESIYFKPGQTVNKTVLLKIKK